MYSNIKNYIKLTFEKALFNSKKRIAKFILFFFAVIESIIFPIPVDPLLAFMVLAEKKKFFNLTIICTMGSVFGGMIGWLIGHYFGNDIQNLFILIPWITEEMFLKVLSAHNEHGNLIVFLGAFTPLPFKIICVSSGIFGIELINFTIMAFIGRGLRFFIISTLVKNYGEQAIKFVNERLFLITTLIGVIIILMFYF